MKGEMWCAELERLSGQDVEEISGRGESFIPIGGRHVGLK